MSLQSTVISSCSLTAGNSEGGTLFHGTWLPASQGMEKTPLLIRPGFQFKQNDKQQQLKEWLLLANPKSGLTYAA